MRKAWDSWGALRIVFREYLERMNRPRALIFDLDGVLIDTEALHQEAKKIAFARHGLQVPENLYPRFRGRSDLDMATHVAGAYGPPGLSGEDVVASKHAAFEALQDRIEA